MSTIPPRRSHVHIVRPEFLDSVHFAGQFQSGEKLVPDCMEHRPWHVPRAVRHTLHGRQPGLIGQRFSHHSEHPAPPWAISLGGKASVLLLRSCSSYSMAIVSSKDRRPGQKLIAYKFCTLVWHCCLTNNKYIGDKSSTGHCPDMAVMNPDMFGNLGTKKLTVGWHGAPPACNAIREQPAGQRGNLHDIASLWS